MPGSVNGLRNFTLHWQLHMPGTRHSVDTASVNLDKHTYIVDIYLMCPAFTSHRPRPSPMAIKMRLAFDYFQYFYCPRKFNKRKTFELLVLPKKARYMSGYYRYFFCRLSKYLFGWNFLFLLLLLLLFNDFACAACEMRRMKESAKKAFTLQVNGAVTKKYS